MKVFLTGGTGFIGCHVLRSLLNAGFTVRALRRTSYSKTPIELSIEPEWCEGSLGEIEPGWIREVDVIIHLAAAGVTPKLSTCEELIQVNILGASKLIQMAAESQVKRFIAIGTSHEYGSSAEGYTKIPPNAPLKPINTYSASKAAAFHMMRSLAIEAKIEFFYGRIFTAYGEGQFARNFWPSLRDAALKGDDFPMTSGKQITDFVPVEQVASQILHACTRNDLKKGIPFVLNIGSGKARSLLEFAESEWIRLEARGRLLPKSLPDRANQVYRLVPDLQGLEMG